MKGRLLLLLSLLLSNSVLGQHIIGSVTDPYGRYIPDVLVEIVNSQSQELQDFVLTDGSGYFNDTIFKDQQITELDDLIVDETVNVIFGQTSVHLLAAKHLNNTNNQLQIYNYSGQYISTVFGKPAGDFVSYIIENEVCNNQLYIVRNSRFSSLINPQSHGYKLSFIKDNRVKRQQRDIIEMNSQSKSSKQAESYIFRIEHEGYDHYAEIFDLDMQSTNYISIVILPEIKNYWINFQFKPFGIHSLAYVYDSIDEIFQPDPDFDTILYNPGDREIKSGSFSDSTSEKWMIYEIYHPSGIFEKKKIYTQAKAFEESTIVDSVELRQNLCLACETDSIFDIEGNGYRTIKIGDQWWMAENLRTTKYNNGISIPVISTQEEYLLELGDLGDFWYRDEPFYVWYQYDSITRDEYGAFYNAYTFYTEDNLCPAGWHVPTDAEWMVLERYIGMNDEDLFIVGSRRGDDEYLEQVLKSKTGWHRENNGGDFFGFNGIPTGEWDYMGSSFGYRAIWWTSTLSDTNEHEPGKVVRSFFDRRLYYDHGSGIRRFSEDSNYAKSIRCIKDSE